MSFIIEDKKIYSHECLSRWEIECLYWAARGKTSEETALILNIKPATVEFYRREIRRKLNCVSMAQAVFEGMQLQNCIQF